MILNNYTKKDPILHQLEPFPAKKQEPLPTWKRVAYLTAPLLTLHPLGSLATSVGMGAYQIVDLSLTTYGHLQQGERCKALACSLKIVFISSCIFLSVSLPLLYSLTATTIHVAEMAWAMRSSSSLEKKEIASLLFQLLTNIVHLSYQLDGSWELMALSLFCQGVEHLKQALKEKEWPEAIVHALIGVFRIAQTKPFAIRFYRDQFGKALTQSMWDDFYKNGIKTEKPLDLDAFLIKKGLSGRIQGIDFTELSDSHRIQTQYLRFKNCDFSNLQLKNSTFHFTRFSDCNFQETTFIRSVFFQTLFKRCDLSFASFFESQLNSSRIVFSNLFATCFDNSYLIDSLFFFSALQETTFLTSIAKKSVILGCELENTLFLEKDFFSLFSSPNHQTKPVIAFPNNFYENGTFTPLIIKSLRDNGAAILFINANSESVDALQLNTEVETLLKEISKAPLPPGSSYAQELLKRAPINSEIHRLIQRVEKMAPFIHGVSIPGNGDDVHPELYGSSVYGESSPAPDYQKEIVELALIHLGETKKIPVMGTCRGAQLINVYRGGDLLDHVPEQMGFLQATDFSNDVISKELQLFLETQQTSFIGLSAHHQAIDNLGSGLETVLSFNGIPKMIVSEDGMLLGSQIHPEYYMVMSDEVASFQEKLRPLSPGYLEKWQRVGELNIFIEMNRGVYRFWLKKVHEHFTPSHPPV